MALPWRRDGQRRPATRSDARRWGLVPRFAPPWPDRHGTARYAPPRPIHNPGNTTRRGDGWVWWGVQSITALALRTAPLERLERLELPTLEPLLETLETLERSKRIAA